MIIIIITVVLIKRGIQMILRAEQLNASELKKKINRKLAFKIKKEKKRAGSQDYSIIKDTSCPSKYTTMQSYIYLSIQSLH